jgi:hypothetical protein
MNQYFKIIIKKIDELYVTTLNLIEAERVFFSQMSFQKILDPCDELITLDYYTQTIADFFNFRNP